MGQARGVSPSRGKLIHVGFSVAPEAVVQCGVISTATAFLRADQTRTASSSARSIVKSKTIWIVSSALKFSL